MFPFSEQTSDRIRTRAGSGAIKAAVLVAMKWTGGPAKT